MQNRRWILLCSLLLNAALLLAAAGVYGFHRFERGRWQTDTRAGAKYAGAMQARADYDAGIERYYRLETPPGGASAVEFYGELNGGVEAWLWLVPPQQLSEESRDPIRAFVDAYNNQMRALLGRRTTRPAD